MKTLFVFIALFFSLSTAALAQPAIITPGNAPTTTTGSAPAENEALERNGISDTKRTSEYTDTILLFEERPARQLNAFNAFAFSVQKAIRQGVPASTVSLILLLPFLATLIAFLRQIIGLPSLEMFVPIALSVALVATGITAGLILLVATFMAAFASRLLLKRIRIMQIPKMALSMFVVSAFIFATLVINAAAGAESVTRLSIFPILIFILLSDQIVALHLLSSTRETIIITAITISIGVLGYGIISLPAANNIILLYPEWVLAVVPVNILIGRYFGLRATEYIRFAPIHPHGDK